MTNKLLDLLLLAGCMLSPYAKEGKDYVFFTKTPWDWVVYQNINRN